MKERANLYPFTVALSLWIVLCSHTMLAIGQGLDREASPRHPDVPEVVPIPLTRSIEFEDKNILFPARGGKVDWGLALSGGGIRSGSYSIGVMKALYDSGLLDHIDAISTVSGGGYASYWLYGSYTPGSGEKFGQNAFGNDSYLENICNLQNDADMYSLGKMVRALFLSKSAAFDNYRNAIHRTFGRKNPNLNTRLVEAYLKDINEDKIPFFLLNTSIRTKELDGLANIIEIAPTHVGNPILGYSKWAPGRAINHGDAVAAASAGVAFKLRKGVPNPVPHTLFNHTEIFLHDGGKSENLGALGLIRRGLENVIIVDAGLDPKYEYTDYLRLQRLLKGIEIDFCVPEIDACSGTVQQGQVIPTGVMKGHAKRSGTSRTVSNIYFVKMSQSADIFPIDQRQALARLRTERERIQMISKLYDAGRAAALERDAKIKKSIGAKSSVRCSEARGLTVRPEMYRYLTNSYGYYLNASKWKNAGKVDDFLTYQFPHTTTVDQSFYADQMEAFIGLGYLQANSLAQLINR